MNDDNTDLLGDAEQQVHSMNDAEFSSFIESEVYPLINPEKSCHQSPNTNDDAVTESSPSINMESLRNRYPHLINLCDYFERVQALSSLRSDKQFSLPEPIILLGEPGTGKTDFCITTAASLHAEVEIFDCSSSSASFLLTGSSSTYRNGKRGIIYNLVHNKMKQGKSWLILDEIDKSSARVQHPILPALGNLFEPATACRFTDEFDDEICDATTLNFICTANSLDGIPAHILDRCTVIECPNPDYKQKMIVVNSVWDDLRIDVEADNFSLADGVVPMLCETDLSMRTIKRLLVHAVAVAVMDNRTEIICDDVVFVISSSVGGLPSSSRIGFM